MSLIINAQEPKSGDKMGFMKVNTLILWFSLFEFSLKQFVSMSVKTRMPQLVKTSLANYMLVINRPRALPRETVVHQKKPCSQARIVHSFKNVAMVQMFDG